MNRSEIDSTRFSSPVSAPLIRLILSRAFDRPKTVAIRAGSKEMEYSTLVGMTNRFTAALRRVGMQRNDVIGLAVDREPETVALMLGVLQGGGACLPLDTSYPLGRLDAMLTDARPRFVVGSESNHGRLTARAPWVSREELTSVSSHPGDAEPGEMAYVLFTSGSTGRPKGVAMRTSVVSSLISWQAGHPRLGKAARTLQFAPLSFDVSFQEILSTLATGGTLVLPSEAERKDPFALLELIASERIERLFLPYVVLHALAEAVGTGGAFPATLHDVVSSGERLRITPAIRSLFSALPNCLLHNHYGPTETHVVTSLELSDDPSAWPELPTIGWPLPYVRVRIVDHDLNPASPGAEGELLLGGDCLAAGYIHHPELTDERFIELDGSRWYRTGDLAAYLSDGEIVYLGRLDDQIKLNGFRIEPAEIESTLCRHEAVGETAVVVAVREQREQLIAHVAPRVGHAGDNLAKRLLSYCEAQLPAHLIPQRIVIHEKLPLNPNGKIDRRALSRGSVAPSMSWPENQPIERQLAVLWTRLLGLTDINPDANFFDLGARSVTVVDALTELRRHGFSQLNATHIYEHPSIALLSKFLTGPREAPGLALPAQERAERQRAALSRFKPDGRTRS